ncbi:MAG: glutamate 5-kinase [candidate division FCPU426 bacterium]
MQRRQQLGKTKRLVVKVGTSLLTAGGGEPDQSFMAKLAAEVAEQRRAGREVILVTSGAIGMGLSVMRLQERPRTIPGKQALAAIGQPHLMRVYAQVFGQEQLTTAQVLLTSDDIHDRQRYAHARAALEELLRLGVVPVFNENDTVAVDEIKFGDNDTLSAHVTNLARADLLVILTDVAGLYDANPAERPDACLQHEVDAVDRCVEEMAAGPGTALGTGGMVTKVRAAKMVTGMGEKMAIADGRQPKVLARLLAGERLGTVFFPQGDKLASRKRWIAYALRRRGAVVLDAGASAALKQRGKSLLPSGVKAVEGRFKQGDCVGVKDEHGREFARGLVNYGAEEIQKLCGAKSSQIEDILGYKNADEIIHRDDLALLG